VKAQAEEKERKAHQQQKWANGQSGQKVTNAQLAAKNAKTRGEATLSNSQAGAKVYNSTAPAVVPAKY
jgi:hypothetical protein